MEIKGTRKIAASPETVWNALHDSATLQKCIPGAEEITWQDPNTLFARVNLGIGPIKGTYASTAQVAEQQAPSHMKLVFNRRGASASIEGGATIDLASDAGGTLVTYSATANLGGALAPLDNPLTRPFVDQGLGQFFARLAMSLGTQII
jgi:carbon monoxide dehydrogenase subunit G